MTDDQKAMARLLSDNIREKLYQCLVLGGHSDPVKAWIQNAYNDSLDLRDALTADSANPKGEGLDVAIEALEKASRRSNYPWSQIADYDPQDWKNEGAMELAKKILGLIKSASATGKVRDGWLDIKTAPWGQPILAGCFDENGEWWQEVITGYFEGDGKVNPYAEMHGFTHWMPLPQPPAQEKP
jgi:uncharacterized protein DUF551